jgi:tRNA A-37 threonylcarbamoyl transferase component Bud32
MIETGTLLQDRYLIKSQIGIGGMGAVYLAIDQRFESHVAIKETFYKDEELAEAFEREARLLNSLHHPVLPHVSDYFTEKNGHFLVMQFIEGEDLSEIIKREGAFPLKDVVRWTDDLLDALDYLHSQNPPIIHRDIKPQNLKLTPRGNIILLDFGLAKLVSPAASGAISVFGYSRTYSPLEQIQGTGTDARSDIFSLGATAFHLLTGKPPIDVLSRAAEIVAGNPDPLDSRSEINKDIPENLWEVLRTALSLNAAGRFVSAKAMRQALETAVNIESNVAVEEQKTEPIVIASDAGEVPVISSPENENFPALESFAAAVEQNSAVPEEQFNAPERVNEAESVELADIAIEETAVRNDALSSPNAETISVNVYNERANAEQKNNFWLPIGILAALILCGSLALWFFAQDGDSAAALNQNDNTTQTVSESAPETEQAVSSEPAISAENPASDEILDLGTDTEPDVATVLKPENPSKNDAAAETNAENAADSAKKEDQPSISDEKAAPKSAPRTNSTASAQRRPRQNPAPGEDRTSSVSDVEAIFTGRQSDNAGLSREERRQRRQERRANMTDEEFEQWRQMRRERRRQRQNREYFPPF